jgi:hypothetical protein
MANYRDSLKYEFEAREDSFLLRVRTQMEWDKTAFSRLVQAMKDYCENEAGTELVERWIAMGFWYIPRFTRDWTTHSDFPREHSAEYYEQAYHLLNDLAYWFFMGESPYEKGKETGLL